MVASLRLRRLITLLVAALVLGLALHGACRAIEHHDGAKDAVALCAAAFALVATVGLIGAGRSRQASTATLPLPLLVLLPRELLMDSPRTTSAWLQRFRN
jgi:hypothetical protein